MKRKVLFPLLVVGVGSVGMAAPLGNQAEGEECAANQYYEDGVCKNCAPCANYNRQPSKESRACGRTIEDCGPCLPGFEAEEWTQGRYSPMCSKKADSESPTVRTPSDAGPTNPDSTLFFNGMAILGGIFGAVMLLVTVSLGVLYYKRRQPQPQGRHDEEAAKMLQDGPPPYEPQAPPYEAPSMCDPVGAERFRNEVIICHQNNEAVTNAAPIDDFFDRENRFSRPLDADVDSDRLSNSSEETVADDWVASDVQAPRNVRPVSVIETGPSSPQPQHPIRRTQSLDLDPAPMLGNYEGVHVRLSQQRRSAVGTPSSSLPGSLGDLSGRPADTRCTTPGLPTYTDEGEEPEPPRSFSFSNLADAQSGGQGSLLVPVANTSYDSGFEDEANRRRTYNDAFEVLVFFRLDVKRRRNE